MRLVIHVHPGSRTAGVAGSHDGALVVRVRERAVDGKATEAALRAVASALDVKLREVSLIAGGTSRRKLVEVPDSSIERVSALLAVS